MVAGYDRTPTPLTEKPHRRRLTNTLRRKRTTDSGSLQRQRKHFSRIDPPPFRRNTKNWFISATTDSKYKNAQVLGTITHSSKGLCVAGTHGKTTTSTMTAHLFHQSHIECTAFLGGISQELRHQSATLSEKPLYRHRSRRVRPLFPLAVPFICLSSLPQTPIIWTSTEQKRHTSKTFEHYTTLIQPGGALIIRKGISLQPKVQAGVRVYTYSRDEGDFHAENIRIGNGEIFIDFVAPDTRINNIQLGVPVSINIENGVAAMALAHLNGVTDEEIRQGMNSFRGVDRRFDFKIKNDQVVFLSDYAHHPSEIKQSVLSIRELYKDKKITAIFQPHLYTRTATSIRTLPIACHYWTKSFW